MADIDFVLFGEQQRLLRHGLTATGDRDHVAKAADVAADALAIGIPAEVEPSGLEQVVKRRSIREWICLGIAPADARANLLDGQEGHSIQRPLGLLERASRVHPARIQLLAAGNCCVLRRGRGEANDPRFR